MEIARIPPVLYATHATHGDGAYMQGLHVPGLWYPSFGRTDRVAWTFTYGRVASVDVRIVRCRRGEMFDGAAWRPLSRRTSEVTIKKRAAETWTFWDCDLGTIVGDAHGDAELALPCVRWAGIGETFKDADGGLGPALAKDVDDLIECSRRMSIACFDVIVADAHGRIGHVLSGRMDARPPTSGGVVPRAPDGQPLAPFDEATRPSTVDPPSGWIVSANARPIEAGARSWVPMGDTPARHHRLAAIVGDRECATLDDLARFVLDASDACALRLVAAWAPHMPDHPRARALVEWAATQSGRSPEHFAQLTLWTTLHQEVCRTLLRRHLGARADALLDDLRAPSCSVITSTRLSRSNGHEISTPRRSARCSPKRYPVHS